MSILAGNQGGRRVRNSRGMRVGYILRASPSEFRWNRGPLYSRSNFTTPARPPFTLCLLFPQGARRRPSYGLPDAQASGKLGIAFLSLGPAIVKSGQTAAREREEIALLAAGRTGHETNSRTRREVPKKRIRPHRRQCGGRYLHSEESRTDLHKVAAEKRQKRQGYSAGSGADYKTLGARVRTWEVGHTASVVSGRSRAAQKILGRCALILFLSSFGTLIWGACKLSRKR